MKVKTSELSGAALDWAVAKAEGEALVDGCLFTKDPDDEQVLYSPSTDWAQGGPIIERERIDLNRFSGQWAARLWAGWRDIEYPQGSAEHAAAYRSRKVSQSIEQQGPTALIAAMRCYVASKLGDEVEIPAELLEAA